MRRDIDDTYCSIYARECQARTIGAKGYRSQSLLMRDAGDLVAETYIPESGGLIFAGRRKQLFVGSVRHSLNCTLMAQKRGTFCELNDFVQGLFSLAGFILVERVQSKQCSELFVTRKRGT